MKRPQGILFDYGDTLLTQVATDHDAANIKLLEMVGSENGAALEAMKRLHAEIEPSVWPRCDTASLEIPFRAYLRLLYETLGFKFQQSGEEIELVYWQEAVKLKPEPGIEQALQELEKQGVALAIVSNTVFCEEVLRYELKKWNLEERFQFLMASSDYGLRKPHPALMQLAAKKIDLPPERIWFVGDMKPYDVAGAKAVGMTAVWYNRLQREQDGPEPDLEVRSWEEFCQAVEQAEPV